MELQADAQVWVGLGAWVPGGTGRGATSATRAWRKHTVASEQVAGWGACFACTACLHAHPHYGTPPPYANPSLPHLLPADVVPYNVVAPPLLARGRGVGGQAQALAVEEPRHLKIRHLTGTRGQGVGGGRARDRDGGRPKGMGWARREGEVCGAGCTEGCMGRGAHGVCVYRPCLHNATQPGSKAAHLPCCPSLS